MAIGDGVDGRADLRLALAKGYLILAERGSGGVRLIAGLIIAYDPSLEPHARTRAVMAITRAGRCSVTIPSTSEKTHPT